MSTKTLGTLTYRDLDEHVAWEATGDIADGDELLLPATLTTEGLVPASVGEVWCRSRCRFSNGSTHRACALYKGDSEDGPLVWSVFNGSVDVRLILPPAPDDILAIDGPERFAASFGLTLAEVFPVEISAECTFETPPTRRSIVVYSSGRIVRSPPA